ncbi:MAG: YhfC family intramembrane metalloprotease [Oscillospiraceae bacterium]|nr:YhfC family intramembrane metalloprotease [Oscillospiraceae bacterium]
MDEIQISTLQIIGMIVSGISSTFLPFALWIIWRRKTHAAWIPMLAGVLGYLVIGTVRGAARAILLNPMKETSPWGYYLWQAVFAGVFEECGRYLVFRYLIPNRQNYRDAVSCGIGHGGLEAVLVSHPAENLFAILCALSFRLYGLEGFAPGKPAFFLMDGQDSEGIPEIMRTISGITFPHSLFVTSSNVAAALFQCSMSVLVFTSVHYTDSKKWLVAAVILHTLTDIFPAFYFMHCISEAETTILQLLYDIGVVYLTWRIYEHYGRKSNEWGNPE